MSAYQDRPGSQPRIGDVVQAIITRIKPQFGLFVELPIPRREFEGLIHLSEVLSGHNMRTCSFLATAAYMPHPLPEVALIVVCVYRFQGRSISL